MLRVRVVFGGLPGTPALATHYFSGGDTQTNADNAVSKVGTLWGAIDAQLTSGLNWATDADVAIMNTSDGNVTGVLATTPQTGTGASSSELLPQLVQGLIVWRTNQFSGGRRLIGHTFIPGQVETNNTAGTDPSPSSGLQSAVNAALTAYLTGGTAVPAVWSRKGGVTSGITSATMRDFWSVLRSRRN